MFLTLNECNILFIQKHMGLKMKHKKPDFPHIEAVCAEITACSNSKLTSPYGIVEDYYAFPIIGKNHPQLKEFTIKEFSTLFSKEHLSKLDGLLTIFSLAKVNALFSKESKLHSTMLNNDIVPTARIVTNKSGHELIFDVVLFIGFVNLKTNEFYPMLIVKINPSDVDLNCKLDNYCAVNFTPEITQIIDNLELKNLNKIYQGYQNFFGKIQKNLIENKSIDEIVADIQYNQENGDVTQLFSVIAQWNEAGALLNNSELSPVINHYVRDFVTKDYNQNKGFISLHEPKVTIISKSDDEQIIDVSMIVKPNNEKLLPLLLDYGRARHKNINDDLFNQFKSAIISDKNLSSLFVVYEKQIGVRITLTKVNVDGGSAVMSKVSAFDDSNFLFKCACKSIMQSALFHMTEYADIKSKTQEESPQNIPFSKEVWARVQKINHMYAKCNEQLFSLLNDDNATIADVVKILNKTHVLNDIMFNSHTKLVFEHKANFVPVNAISADILSKPRSWKECDCSFNWDFIFEYGKENTKNLVILISIGKMNEDFQQAFDLSLMLRLNH